MKRKKKERVLGFEDAQRRGVYIEWDDSSTTFGWNHTEPDDNKPSMIKSIGILVGESKTHVTISTSISAGIRFLDKLTIPRACIKKIKHFRLEFK